MDCHCWNFILDENWMWCAFLMRLNKRYWFPSVMHINRSCSYRTRGKSSVCVASWDAECRVKAAGWVPFTHLSPSADLILFISFLLGHLCQMFNATTDLQQVQYLEYSSSLSTLPPITASSAPLFQDPGFWFVGIITRLIQNQRSFESSYVVAIRRSMLPQLCSV